MSVLMYLQEYKRTDELDKSRAVVSLANSAIVYIALDRAHFGERAVSLGWVVLLSLLVFGSHRSRCWMEY